MRDRERKKERVSEWVSETEGKKYLKAERESLNNIQRNFFDVVAAVYIHQHLNRTKQMEWRKFYVSSKKL